MKEFFGNVEHSVAIENGLRAVESFSQAAIAQCVLFASHGIFAMVGISSTDASVLIDAKSAYLI